MKIDVLDFGFAELLDHMGNDASPVIAARVSYDSSSEGSGMSEKDLRLLRYLYRHEHLTPFEQVQLQFKIKAPLFVIKQMIRHRTAKVNEVSFRYVKPKFQFYIPEHWRAQADSNKQGSTEGDFSSKESMDLKKRMADHCTSSMNLYFSMIEKGICREQARMVIPQNLYSSILWSMDMRNLIHFLKLREAEGAQWEIRQYAEAMKRIVRNFFPVIYETAWPELK